MSIPRDLQFIEVLLYIQPTFPKQYVDGMCYYISLQDWFHAWLHRPNEECSTKISLEITQWMERVVAEMSVQFFATTISGTLLQASYLKYDWKFRFMLQTKALLYLQPIQS